ncbi:MAG: DUF4125 family protein [Lachnospiraceae bacterium]|nr:DUF4125 family protein [Lachnospiraceae bacterium]
MDEINTIIEKIDKLFEENKPKEAEKILVDCLEKAKNENDLVLQLQLYNELIGYYRVTSKKEELIGAIEGAIKSADSLGLTGTIPYATTVLNAANGYRSIGMLDKSLEHYEIAESIYADKLDADDMLYAGLYNNISLLFQEQNQYAKAKEYLKRALKIVEAHSEDFEIAVTYANLANTSVLEENYNEAQIYAKKGIEYFDKMKLYDSHYCAALSALGMCKYKNGEFDSGAEYFAKAMEIVKNSLGENSQYYRLKENYDMCKNAVGEDKITGLKLSELFYEKYGRDMIKNQFPDYVSKIAVGLVGEGSDCFGYDDEQSRDHDWGPGFCMWVTDETYKEIGASLQEAYEQLPKEFMGYTIKDSGRGNDRRGVMSISSFCDKFTDASVYEDIDWSIVKDYALAAAVNGKVFVDEEGKFTALRRKLNAGYPENILYLKIAEDVANISQTGQYNYFRMLKRGDTITTTIMMADCIKNVLKLLCHMNNIYPVHDKWLYRQCSMLNDEVANGILMCINDINNALKSDDSDSAQMENLVNEMTEMISKALYDRGYISDVDNYLDHHTEELIMKSGFATHSDKELVDMIATLEFEAFDKVKNEGGRASCQNDWPTFSVMRKSQYLTWNREMLMQYIYDFTREYNMGHNLITEKYGRMMESTAPERYRELEQHFPELSETKKAIIEQIVSIQMDMAEKFAAKHPKIAVNARSLHTYEDEIYDTSYETYLRGEISTYSDKMLQLYGAHIVKCVSKGINVARQTIENTAKLYGYSSLEEFEKDS